MLLCRIWYVFFSSLVVRVELIKCVLSLLQAIETILNHYNDIFIDESE